MQYTPNETTDDTSDRFGHLSVTFFPAAHPESHGVLRVHVRESDPLEPVMVDVMPTQRKRFEIALGDEVLSIEYVPPKISPYARPAPEELRPIRNVSGLR